MNNKFSFVFFLIVIIGFLFAACNSDQSVNSKTNSTYNNDVITADSSAFYEEILAKDSLNTELRIAIATNYYVEKQYKKAIDHLLTVCRIDNNNSEALITLGNIYYDSEQYDKAIVYYDNALTLDKNNVNVRCDMATCYLNINNPEKACSILKENIAMAPEHAQSHHNLSVIYTQLGKTKEATEEINTFNKLSK